MQLQPRKADTKIKVAQQPYFDMGQRASSHKIMEERKSDGSDSEYCFD